MTHEELHRMALRSVDGHEGVIDDDDVAEIDACKAWINAAADALRLQRLGHHDRELLEFVQGERDTAVASAAALAQLRDRLSRELLDAIGQRDQAQAEIARLRADLIRACYPNSRYCVTCGLVMPNGGCCVCCGTSTPSANCPNHQRCSNAPVAVDP